ncbi:uncharacterized protein [Coffea arabica]|uniref:Reverse transcriptase domain-containing protein n=1 Tax=Coffea arabica TaxID=13443 RepID=A0A6P6S9L4_COFAR|nr:uncharacterized protein LOC113689272 [Coffea arabica]
MDLIRKNWQVDFVRDLLYILAAKLRHLKGMLRAWSRESFGNIFNMVMVVKWEVSQLEVCFDENPSDHHRIHLIELSAKLCNAQVNKDMFWHHKAKLQWLSNGDRNSKFFHAVVTKRRHKAVIHRIRSRSGEWLEAEVEIAKEVVSYFQELFSTNSGPLHSQVLDVIPKQLTDQDNADLEWFPTLEEVKDVIFFMDADNVAGSDRLVSNVWFSVIINKSPQRFFKSTRGICQGNSISPTLFIVGAEIPRGCPDIIHLAYTDDMMIFSSELKGSLQLIMRVLEAYCKVSGQ